MADITQIAAVSRTEFGKGAARRTRRAGLVPAVLYGHGSDPIHVSLPGHQTLLALRVANALLSITIDGGEEKLALPKQVQRHPIKDNIEHVDLVIVRRGEKVTVEVPLIVVGHSGDETIVILDQQTVALQVEATNIPADIEVNVAGLEAGATVTAAELKLPEGAVYSGEPEELILSIAVPRAQAEATDAEGEEGAEGEEAAAEEG
ncbi:MAG: 50S ribosomal protein L25/general stress protein Ctc [Propionibacteriaceae bacterium]|jgi:large subunit ribosomal protein L25|nr:50S ribosomal protein L25/general stress protein Ctc [Propionibacteriaceae bacterium]